MEHKRFIFWTYIENWFLIPSLRCMLPMSYCSFGPWALPFEGFWSRQRKVLRKSYQLRNIAVRVLFYIEKLPKEWIKELVFSPRVQVWPLYYGTLLGQSLYLRVWVVTYGTKVVAYGTKAIFEVLFQFWVVVFQRFKKSCFAL